MHCAIHRRTFDFKTVAAATQCERLQRFSLVILLNKHEAKRISEQMLQVALRRRRKIFRYVLIIRSRRICIAFASRDRIAYVFLSPKAVTTAALRG
ncbi:hypothetical protein TNCV_4116601 [Trichonephila clavipes]|nr:hypothetical protein TNCV_4116601 [Trichonephila clavipes]